MLIFTFVWFFIFHHLGQRAEYFLFSLYIWSFAIPFITWNIYFKKFKVWWHFNFLCLIDSYQGQCVFVIFPYLIECKWVNVWTQWLKYVLVGRAWEDMQCCELNLGPWISLTTDISCKLLCSNLVFVTPYYEFCNGPYFLEYKDNSDFLRSH